MKIKVIIAAHVVALAASGAYCQTYPSKPVTLVVPYAAGGSGDAIGRVIGTALSKKWGQPVVVENRAGGSTVSATTYTVRAEADGYTILLNSFAWITNQYLVKGLPYKRNALAPVSLLGYYPEILFVRADMPVNTLPEFIAFAKKSTKPMTFGNSGVGSSPHLASAAFSAAAGIKSTAVPYKGSSAAMNDLIGGQIDAMFEGVTFKPFADTKRVKAIFSAQPNKIEDWKQLPVSSEAGLPGFSFSGWFGLLAPAKTPGAIQTKIATDVAEVLKDRQVRAQLQRLGLTPQAMGPTQFAQFLNEEDKKLGDLIRRHTIQLD